MNDDLWREENERASRKLKPSLAERIAVGIVNVLAIVGLALLLLGVAVGFAMGAV